MIFAGLDLVGAVKRGGTWELQRTYNNVKGGGGDEFVAAFTPAASYVFAVIGRAAGFSTEELLAGGGIYNLLPSFSNSTIDAEGKWWNNPNNVPMIKASVKSLEAGKFNNFKAIHPLPIPQCFLAGTKIRLEGNISKPIEDIAAGDLVIAFDASVQGGLSHLSARKVKRTFRNNTNHIIDLRGLKCTPGHMFLTKKAEGPSKSDFKTISSILKNDGVIVHETGNLVRARTGSLIGSEDDITIRVSYRKPEDDIEYSAYVRAGIPVVDRRKNMNAVPLSGWVHAHNITIHRDGSFQAPDGQRFHAIDWPPDSTPFDLIETQNWVVAAEEQRPYTPPWIAELPQDDRQGSLQATG